MQNSQRNEIVNQAASDDTMVSQQSGDKKN